MSNRSVYTTSIAHVNPGYFIGYSVYESGQYQYWTASHPYWTHRDRDWRLNWTD